MGRRVSPTLVGAFAIGAVAIIVIAIVALGSGSLFRKTRQYVMYFSGSVNGLLVGASVKMEGVPVGAVKEIRLGFNPRGEPVDEIPAKVKIAVIVELDENMLRARGVRNVDLADPQHIERAVQHGLRGVLAMESLLTGILYVDLEMLPDTPANFVQQENDEYVEIPTIPTALEQAQVTITQILEHLQRADFDKTLSDLSATLEALKKFTSSPQLQDAVTNLAKASAQLAATAASIRRLADNMNAQTGPLAKSLRQTADKANLTLAQAQAALANLQATFDPQAPLALQLNETLIELSKSARSMRELTDYLERNPSSIVRGK
jgi:paraquat-inducible protein B